MTGTVHIVQKIHNQGVLKGLQRLPDAIQAEVDAELGAIAKAGAGEMKQVMARNGSAADSTMINSVDARKLAIMHWWVGPSVNYARAVNEGTGPAAGKPNYMPDPEALEGYIKRRGNIRLKGKPGSSRRTQVLREIRDRAWGMAVHIWHHGTKPHNFVNPTADFIRGMLPARIAGAVQRGAQKAMPA